MMESGEEIRKLLQEIRDIQRDHLAEYRKVAERSLEIQQRAVARQEQYGRHAGKVFVFGGLLVVVLVVLLALIVARWSRQLLGI